MRYLPTIPESPNASTLLVRGKVSEWAENCFLLIGLKSGAAG